jgi:parvulin-like peptidyl-prolyl isomerase
MALGFSTLRTLRPRAAHILVFGALFVFACHKKSEGQAGPAASASAAASAAPRTLSPEQAQQVLARVGERTITLGDYAAALERMDTFERLRYQSPDRRKLLLNEMIELELFAQEAKRRGLDKQPETQERLRQMLREELLRTVRAEVKSASDLPEADVRKYYDEHKADFNEPERRRVSHIAVASANDAKAILGAVKDATAAEWGKLVSERSLDKGPRSLGATPAELAGDLGIVGPPGHPRGANPRVPEALRAAVFKIEKVGGVLGEVVPDGGLFHVVRLAARTEARERSFEEAERTIRINLVQELIRQREVGLEQELARKFPVTIDDAALAKVHAPKPGASGAPVDRPKP